MEILRDRARKEWVEFRVLLRAVPTGVTLLFVLSVVAMNLLANKSIALPYEWMAADAGYLISWAAFLSMDVVTKHFGAKAANELSVLALSGNLLASLLFYIGSRIPGTWSAAGTPGEAAVINAALDSTFGGTWYVLLGSSIAFLASALINSAINTAIGRRLSVHGDNFGVFAARSYGSTAIAQLVDNLTFTLIVSHSFFGWSLGQCFASAMLGMLIELLAEVLFSPLGYRICRRWERQAVGAAYFRYRQS